jgi:hypothetical protein
MLGKIINTLNDDRFERKQVQELLYWLWWTLGKWYDDEEQADTIKDNCKEWIWNPNCFRD